MKPKPFLAIFTATLVIVAMTVYLALLCLRPSPPVIGVVGGKQKTDAYWIYVPSTTYVGKTMVTTIHPVYMPGNRELWINGAWHSVDEEVYWKAEVGKEIRLN